MRKYIAEFIGTFFLVLTVGATVLPGPAAARVPPLPRWPSVLRLMIMVYAGGHISGGHFNPAVTLAVFTRGKLDVKEVFPYWIAQFLAAMTAAMAAMFVIGQNRRSPDGRSKASRRRSWPSFFSRSRWPMWC